MHCEDLKGLELDGAFTAEHPGLNNLWVDVELERLFELE